MELMQLLERERERLPSQRFLVGENRLCDFISSFSYSLKDQWKHSEVVVCKQVGRKIRWRGGGGGGGGGRGFIFYILSLKFQKAILHEIWFRGWAYARQFAKNINNLTIL